MKEKPHFNKALLFCAFAGLFYFGLIDNGRGPAYPEILRGLGFSNREGSFLFALTSLLSFLLTIFSHKWLKNLSLEVAMKWGWAFLSLSALFYGLSGFLVSGPLIILASFIQGIGMGMTGMTMNLMVEAASPASHRRRTFSALHGTYGVASFLAPLLYTWFKDFGLSWPHFFFALALLGPVIFIAAPKTNDDDQIFSHIPDPNLDFKLPLPFLIILGLTVGTYVASEIVVSSRLVLFLEEGQALTNKEASYYLSGFFIALMGGRLFMGLVDIPFHGSSILLTSLLSTMTLLLLGHQGYLICFSLTGLSMSVFFPAFMDWLADSFPRDFQKTTTFVLSGIGLHLVLMHLGFGQIAEKLGIKKAMGLATLLTLASLVLTLISLSWTKRLQAISKQPKES